MTTITTTQKPGRRTAARVGRSLRAGMVGGAAGGLLSVALLTGAVIASTLMTEGGVNLVVALLLVYIGIFLVILLVLASATGMAIGILAGTLLAIGICVMPRPLSGWQQAAVLLTGAIMGAWCVHSLVGPSLERSVSPILQLLTWIGAGALPGLYMAHITVKPSGAARDEPSVAVAP